jgi:leucyl aminopeptidase
MNIRYVDTDPLTHDTPLMVVALTEGATASQGVLARLDADTGGAVARAFEAGDVRASTSDEFVFYGEDGGPKRIALLGLGAADELDAEGVRRMAGRGVRLAERLRLPGVSFWVDASLPLDASVAAQSAAEGASLAAWRFREMKSFEGEDDAPVDVVSIDILGDGDAAALTGGVELGTVIAAGENLARTLQSRPGNVATPSHLADEASRMCAEVGLEVMVLDEERMRQEGMVALLEVSRGSEEEARLIVMEHRGGEEGAPPLVLVGKGLTFDAGGISLKPPAGMEEMKYDMSGGAAVIGAMQAIARLGVKANVTGIVPSSENLPSGTALKPGDVIGSLAGKTIEVVNTDAEGRLILADALAYGARLEPAAMVDCATLTGAVVIGLGHHAAAVMGSDDGLIGELIAAGESSGERCWQLPLWKEYRKQLDSEVADIVNVGGRPGGSITAACFLADFAGERPWAHLDIAGTAYGDGTLSYQRKGAYGFPTRLLVEWVRGRAE